MFTKTWLIIIIIKVTKKQGFTLSLSPPPPPLPLSLPLEGTFLETPQEREQINTPQPF